MELKREHWTNADGKEFGEYLMTFGRGEEKGKWEQRIINTALPCIAVPSPTVKKIVSEIAKGNLIEFIDLWLWNNFTETSITGGLICKINEFGVMSEYLKTYAEKQDNWAGCDLLKFKINDGNKDEYFKLGLELVENEKPFVRRVGLNIIFAFSSDETYTDRIFSILSALINEREYYVNMMAAWLVSELFVKQREKTLQFLETGSLNAFTVNKAVQKCRDSYRVTSEDKETLLKFKRKTAN